MTKINSQDDFGQWAHQKLAHHQVDIDLKDWDILEQHLAQHTFNLPKRNKRVVWLWQSAAAMVVAAAIFLAWFLFPHSSTEIIPSALPITEALSPSASQPASPSVIDLLMQSESLNETLQPMYIAQAEPIDIHHPEIFITPTESEIKKEVSNKEVSKLTEEKKEIPIKMITTDQRLPIEKNTTPKYNKWTLAAAFGSGNSHSQGAGNQHRGNLQSAQSIVLKSDGNRYAYNLSSSIQPFDKMTKDDYSSILHLPPFSFGVMARTHLREADVEFGVEYNLLSSRYSWTESGVDYDVRQSLHYIGIPVNLIGRLSSTHPYWKIYIKAGVMAEKGLRGIYKQERRSPNRHTITTVKSGIDGLQWSVNGAIGVSYQIIKNLNLYFEPRVGYNFDCNQPISMRTEWPFAVGFGMGASIELW